MIRLQAAGQPTLALYHQPAQADLADVIYVHGSTFGAELSVLWQLDGRSWADALCDAGFNVWAFDFAGYGASDRYSPDATQPAGDMAQVLPQLQRVVAAVRARNRGRRVVLLAHSWGGTVALNYASVHADDLMSLVLFAPILARAPSGEPPTAAPVPPYLLLSAWAQYRRFIEDVPSGAAQPLSEAHFEAWSKAFLATDPEACERIPPAVLSPAGPQSDVRALRNGRTFGGGCDVPTLLLRGEWDRACDAADMNRLQALLANATQVTIPGATHLMHLEVSRGLLYNAVNAFLSRGVT
ncbi:alpha/beta hydrolase [Duganella radicis]|uniref:Alpha/beta fold hydrolase n=1 Tax=Duganella radicis TaxID=551988 RepID=A0A6L6PQY2_9BURK|nr:alpha/beta fold hydrolase [Duganella radicis]MTV41508.1 alpha/beta fold hydrolase [Duganella radicis]